MNTNSLLKLMTRETSKNSKLMYVIFAFLSFCFASNPAFANVAVTAATGGTNICHNTAADGTAPAYTTLGVITVTEGANTDFATGLDQIVLTAPPGWQFNTAVTPTFGFTAGRNVVAVFNAGFSAGTLTIDIVSGGTNSADAITITGLQVEPTTMAAAAGYMYASGTTGVTGITTGAAGTNFGNLSQTGPTVYTLSAGGGYCTGLAGFDLQLSGSQNTVSYQLYNSGVLSGAAIPGTGAAPLDLGLQPAGTYSVLGTDGTGCTSAMSGTSAVIMEPLPSVYTVTGTGNVCPGSTGIYIDLNFSDIGVNYQLYNGAFPTGPALPGALSSLSFGPEAAAGTYTVLATNATTGCMNNMAGFGSINVLPAPAQYTVTGASGYCADVAGTDITLSNSVSGTTYQLYNGAMAIGPVMNGTTGSPIDFGIQPAGAYSVLATITATGCTGGMLNTLNVVMNPLPIQYTVGGGGGYCMGGAGAEITLSNSETTVNYQLYYGTFATGPVVIGTAVPPLDMGQGMLAGTYTVFATNPTTGCTNNMLGSATVTVNPVPPLHNVIGGGGYCMGGLGVHVGLDGSNTGINYQLYVGAAMTGTVVAGATGSTIDFGLQTTGGVYTVIGEDATTFCTSTMTGAVTVTVNPLPNIYTLTPTSGSYCAGGPGVDLNLSGSDLGVNYQVYSGAATAGPAVPGTGATPTDLGFQTTATTYTVLATNATTFCQSPMSGSATVSINPLPTAYNVTGSGGYCAGGSGVAVGLANSDAGVSYQLYNGAVMIGPAVNGTGSAITFGVQPAGTYTVLATNMSTFCTNAMNGSAIVIMNLLPTQYTVSGGGAYCAGGLGADVQLNGSDTGVTYQLYVGAFTTGAALAGTGAALDFGNQITAGTYTVFATNNTTTCTNGMLGSVVVSINPLPTTYNVTGGGTLCAGGAGYAVGLSNSDMGVNYQLYLNGSPLGGLVGGTNAAFSFGTYTYAGTYLAVATNTVTLCQSLMTGSAVIVVNPQPGPINGIRTVCVNSTSLLSNDSTGGMWSSNDNTIASIDPSTGLMTGVGSGNTTITYTLPTTCFATAPATVNPLPVVTAIMGTTNECAGSGSSLSDATATGVWSSTNPTIATIDIAGNVNGITAGIVTISYTVTNGFGCIAAATTPDTVNALPVVPAIGGPAMDCIGQAVTLTNSTTGGVWSSADITIATIDAAMGTLTGVTAGTVDITYTVTSLANCVTAVSTNETINPSPAVSPVSGPTSVCTGLTISLNDATGGGVWSSSDNTTATVDAAGTVTGVAFGSAIISYTVSNVYGCYSSATDNLTVGNPMPASFVTPGSSATLCNGTPQNLVLTTTGSGLTYQWAINGNDIAGATDANYIADSVASFAITLNNGTCSETLAATNVIAPPAPVISYNSAGNYLYTGSYATYQWYKNGTPITGATGSILTVTGAGEYKVVVSDANGCYVAAAPYTVNGTGGGGGGGGGGSTGVNNTIASAIRIYPNPATSAVRIDASVNVNIVMVSPDGKVVLEQKQATNVDVSQLADGLYIIMVYDENSILLRTDKFAKIK